MRIVVSDHAIVRYMERVYKLDLEPIKREIVKTVETPAKVGAARYSKDGITYAIGKVDDGYIVTTVICNG